LLAAADYPCRSFLPPFRSDSGPSRIDVPACISRHPILASNSKAGRPQGTYELLTTTAKCEDASKTADASYGAGKKVRSTPSIGASSPTAMAPSCPLASSPSQVLLVFTRAEFELSREHVCATIYLNTWWGYQEGIKLQVQSASSTRLEQMTRHGASRLSVTRGNWATSDVTQAVATQRSATIRPGRNLAAAASLK
jgi:hypothetical protein